MVVVGRSASMFHVLAAMMVTNNSRPTVSFMVLRLVLLLLLLRVESIFCFHSGSIALANFQKSGSLDMVRNIDLAEAIVFYGKESLFEGSSNDKKLLPGVKYLVEECKRDDTAVLAILEDDGDDDVGGGDDDQGGDGESSLLPSLIKVCSETQAPPNPRDLWEAIHSVVVQPKGFGGSSGFGTKAADPERAPLPKHCVVLCHTEDQCRAARFCGTRVLCLTNNDLADAVLFDGTWESICMDDVATPGSFWLNPPHPRDDDSNAVDPEAIIHAMENLADDDGTLQGGSSKDNDSASDGEDFSDDQLAAMLADIDPL